VDYHSDDRYNTSKATAEATLDVEVMVGLAPGIPVNIINLPPTEWILDWAAKVVDEFTPDDGGW